MAAKGTAQSPVRPGGSHRAAAARAALASGAASPAASYPSPSPSYPSSPTAQASPSAALVQSHESSREPQAPHTGEVAAGVLEAEVAAGDASATPSYDAPQSPAVGGEGGEAGAGGHGPEQAGGAAADQVPRLEDGGCPQSPGPSLPDLGPPAPALGQAMRKRNSNKMNKVVLPDEGFPADAKLATLSQVVPEAEPAVGPRAVPSGPDRRPHIVRTVTGTLAVQSALGIVSCKVLVRRPLCMIAAMQCLTWALCCALFTGGALNTDFSSFTRASSNSSLNADAFEHAWRVSEYAPGSPLDEEPTMKRRLQAQYEYLHRMISLVYHCEDGNILTEERLHAVRQFEASLKGMAEWQELCRDSGSVEVEGGYQTCDPGESLVTFVWPEMPSEADFSLQSCARSTAPHDLGEQPDVESCKAACLTAGGDGCNMFFFGKDAEAGSCSWEEYTPACADSDSDQYDTYVREVPSPFADAAFGNTRLKFNGQGSTRLPVEFALAGLQGLKDRSMYDRLQRFLPDSFTVPTGGGKAESSLLRSYFLFSASYAIYEGITAQFASSSEALDAYETFLEDSMHPVLIGTHETLEAHGIKLYYYSAELDDIDIFHALWSDCRLALGSMAVVLLIMRLHTKSTPLALFGLFLVLECIPVGYIFFKQFSGLADTGIINCLSIFVLVGIGSDLVFVIHDGWHSAKGNQKLAAGASKDEQERWLLHCLQEVVTRSGAGCTTTTLCAASSFLVNLGSALAPLREFGLFMGLCVLFSLALQISMFPLALVAMERRRLRRTQEAGAASSGCTAAGVAVAPDAHQADSASTDPPSPSRRVVTKEDSAAVRFFNKTHTNAMYRWRLRIIAGFLLVALVGIIGSALTVAIDGSMPEIFPSHHNQVMGKTLEEQFASNNMELASTAVDWDSWKCGLTARLVEGALDCEDASQSCSSWSSMGYCEAAGGVGDSVRGACRRTCRQCSVCFAQWCKTEDEPAVEQNDDSEMCECYEDGAELPAGESTWHALQTIFVGLDQTAWPDLETKYVAELADGRWGGPFVEKASEAADLPPLAQQHWRTGASAQWPAFAAPLYRTSGTAGANLQNVKRRYCYCKGVTRCADTGVGRLVFNFTTESDDPAAEAEANASAEVNASAAGGSERRLLEGPAAADEGVAAAWPVRATAWGSPAARGAARRLATESGATVRIVWGIQVQELGPFDLFAQTATDQYWDFTPMFNPADPWSQRSMLVSAEGMPASLRVASTADPRGTWLHVFEAWLGQKGRDFPSPSFDVDIALFLTAFPEFGENFLREPGSGVVKATMVDFHLELGEFANIDVALQAKEAWDDYVDECNVAASIHAKGAWHTSPLWVRVAAQSSILNSTIATVLISITIGFVAAAVFTQSLWLAALAMISIVLIIISLLFIKCCLMGWTLGAVEVVALIVFLGYMFTFNLHIVHAYGHFPDEHEAPAPKLSSMHGEQGVLPPRSIERSGERIASERSSERSPRSSERSDERLADWDDDLDSVDRLSREIANERFRRTRFALTVMGRSLLGSAVTSAGCAIFLLFCTLQFFVKFGVVILLVTCLSLVYSLIFLPCLLMVAGPTDKSCPKLTVFMRESWKTVVEAPLSPSPSQAKQLQYVVEASDHEEVTAEAPSIATATQVPAGRSLQITQSAATPGEMNFSTVTPQAYNGASAFRWDQAAPRHPGETQAFGHVGPVVYGEAAPRHPGAAQLGLEEEEV